MRNKHTDSLDSSCSISASELSPPPTWRVDISEREERKKVEESKRGTETERREEKKDNDVVLFIDCFIRPIR